MEFERKIDQTRYSFVEKTEDSADGSVVITGIRLNDEGYLGFVYRYENEVRFDPEENPDGTRNIQFDYAVLSLGTVEQDELDTPEFKTLLGDILIDIISEQLETHPDTIKFVGTTEEE